MEHPSDPAWIAACARAPMVEHLLFASLGMVVHSAWAAGRVEGMTLGDVTVAPLPVEPVAEPTDAAGRARRRPRRGDACWRRSAT